MLRRRDRKAKGKTKVKDTVNQVIGIIMVHVSKNDKHTHVSVNEGIRRHGDEALHILLSEFGQIHRHDTFEHLDISKLLAEVKKEALNLITMIREKRCGKIKSRACANGMK